MKELLHAITRFNLDIIESIAKEFQFSSSKRKQLKHVKHQHVPKHVQEQYEHQVQPMGNKPMNAPNMDVA